MKIARVFPRKTSHSPTDQDCYFSEPGLFTPKYDRIHISVVFDWDILRAEDLAIRWAGHGKVSIGGPAFGDPCGEFTPGLYNATGITFTSRGCPRSCKFCFVPEREGKIRELDIKTGNNVCDNNLLACSKSHIERVFDMLKTQKGVKFSGGLDARLLRSWHIELLKGISIHSMFFACDHVGSIKALEVAAGMLGDFSVNKKRCYVLIGDDYDENLDRLKIVYSLGFLPFAQLRKYDFPLRYDKKFRDLQRTFSRPAATKAYMKSYANSKR